MLRDIQVPARSNDLPHDLSTRFPGPVRGLVDSFVNALRDERDAAGDGTALDAALSMPLSTGDDFDALATLLRRSGLAAAGDVALEAAVLLDVKDESLTEPWGGPFNGQECRQRMFLELVRKLDIRAIVETGTFRGSTTAFMADSAPSLPLFSCELSERFFRYARIRLAERKTVRLFCNDSRTFLTELLVGESLPAHPVFFYLDAHWLDDLPLWREIDLIFAHRSNAVVMVDDFRVPGDLGFGYDDYGPGKCLCVHDLRASVAAQVEFFFPSASSAGETGAKRGVVVLAAGEMAECVALQSQSLQRLDWRQAISLDLAVNHSCSQALRIRELDGQIGELRHRIGQLQCNIEQLQCNIEELQQSRWRRLGIRLGVAKKATFEHEA